MKKGFYVGGTFGVPTPIGGVGGGLYVDSYRNAYPQLYYGTPHGAASMGNWGTIPVPRDDLYVAPRPPLPPEPSAPPGGGSLPRQQSFNDRFGDWPAPSPPQPAQIDPVMFVC